MAVPTAAADSIHLHFLCFHPYSKLLRVWTYLM